VEKKKDRGAERNTSRCATGARDCWELTDGRKISNGAERGKEAVRKVRGKHGLTKPKRSLRQSARKDNRRLRVQEGARSATGTRRPRDTSCCRNNPNRTEVGGGGSDAFVREGKGKTKNEMIE